MAEENVRQLVALQPQGPYLLGGFCNGGQVAYEMARQLKQKGLEVGVVILVEAAVPRHFRWLKALIRYGGWLARLNVGVQTYVYWRLRGFLASAASPDREGLRTFLTVCLRKARTDLLLRLGTATEEPVRPTLDDPQWRLRALRYVSILKNYLPKPYAGRVVLLRTKWLESDYPTDRTVGWGKLAAQLEVHELPGDHYTCVTEHLEVVAERIGRCLHTFHEEPEKALAQRKSS
jgi:thioesterase domain-containing protein